jgi:hypothetical protein
VYVDKQLCYQFPAKNDASVKTVTYITCSRPLRGQRITVKRDVPGIDDQRYVNFCELQVWGGYILFLLPARIIFLFFLGIYYVIVDINSTKLSTAGQRAVTYTGPSTWNTLPKHLREAALFETFKQQLKTFLFN